MSEERPESWQESERAGPCIPDLPGGAMGGPHSDRARQLLPEGFNATPPCCPEQTPRLRFALEQGLPGHYAEGRFKEGHAPKPRAPRLAVADTQRLRTKYRYKNILCGLREAPFLPGSALKETTLISTRPFIYSLIYQNICGIYSMCLVVNTNMYVHNWKRLHAQFLTSIDL